MIWSYTHGIDRYEVHNLHVDDALRLWLVPVRAWCGNTACVVDVLRYDTETRKWLTAPEGMQAGAERALLEFLRDTQDGNPDWARRVA